MEVLKADLHVVYGRVREEEMERAVSDINHTYGMGKMRKVWNLVNNVSGKKKGFAGKICGGSVQERLDSWKRHFTGLLGKEPCVSKILVEEEMEISEELPISVEPFTYDEYWNVVKRLDDGKGAGADGIRPEALKRGGNDLASFLVSVTELWRKEIPLANGQSLTSFLSPRVDPSPTVTIIEVSACAL